jgi:ABC-2 type transport system permease protein
MAGIETPPGTLQHLTSRQHFATIAWLRWRIFVNTLRGKGAAGELVAKVLSYPLLALMVLGPAGGAGFGSWYFVSKGEVRMLAIVYWIVFGLWQLIGMNTSATGPSFDLGMLIRFPLRYRDYFLIRLSFGLLEPPTLAGIACLVASAIGIAIANVSLLPWAALLLAVYAACNVFFSRMIYSWLERWLAQRRARELVTGIFIGISIGVQFFAQYAERLSHSSRNASHSPWMIAAAHILLAVNWLLPPGLTAASIDHFQSGAPLIAVSALAGLLAYTAVFVLVLHLRLHAQFRGEDLSEAPAQSKPKTAVAKTRKATGASSEARAQAGGGLLAFLPATVAACLIKEVRYLLRSGPKLYVLIMPVFIVFLFSVRSSGLEYSGVGGHRLKGMLFAYGCAYMQLIFVALIYNSLGSDGAGVQFYFMAPLRMRDVMLAKNLLVFAIFAIEAVLIYICSAYIATPSPLDLTVSVLAWSLFAMLINMSVGNVRSILSPKGVDAMRVRSQNVSGLSSIISLTIVALLVGMGIGTFSLCRMMNTGYWPAALIFTILAALGFIPYLAVMARIDGIAASHVEDLTRVLGRTQ